MSRRVVVRELDDIEARRLQIVRRGGAGPVVTWRRAPMALLLTRGYGRGGDRRGRIPQPEQGPRRSAQLQHRRIRVATPALRRRASPEIRPRAKRSDQEDRPGPPGRPRPVFPRRPPSAGPREPGSAPCCASTHSWRGKAGPGTSPRRRQPKASSLQEPTRQESSCSNSPACSPKPGQPAPRSGVRRRTSFDSTRCTSSLIPCQGSGSVPKPRSSPRSSARTSPPPAIWPPTPVTRRSGTSIRGDHSSVKGNKTLKLALFLSSFAPLKCKDHTSRTYYEKKRAEGRNTSRP